MKKNEIKRVVEEVVRVEYIAEDGQVFSSEEQCKEYENSAKVVIYNRVKEKMIAKTNEYDIFNIGCEDNTIEIFYVDSTETVELLNRYIWLYDYSKVNINFIPEDMIGKEVMMTWGYDHDYAYNISTIGDFLVECRQRFENIVAKAKEEK